MRASRQSLWLALYAAFVVAVIPTYFQSFPLPEFLPKLKALVSIFYFTAVSFSVGDFLLYYLVGNSDQNSQSYPSAIFRYVVPLWFGFGVIGLSVLILGWLIPGDLTYKFFGLNILLTVSFVWTVFKNRIKLPEPIHFELSPLEIICLTIGALGALVVFVGCFSPITYYDSLVYHLALPSIYNQAGKISSVPSNLYSYFPANVEMIFLFIINQFPEPEYVINLWGWVGSMSLALAVAAWAYEWGGRKQACLAFLFWWSMPAVLLLSTGGYVDLPLGGFIFMALRAFCVSYKNNSETRWLFLSGLFGGFAVSTKYTGAICPMLLGLFLAFFWLVRGKTEFKKLVLFLVGCLLPASFWFCKNWISIGNPFFPFFYKWLGGDVGWSASNASGYFSQLSDYGFKSNLLYELLLAPWNLSTSAIKYGGGYDVLGDFGWPLILLTTLPAFFFPKGRPVYRIVSFYTLGHFLIWFLTKPVFRFLIGLLPVAIMLSSFAIAKLLDKKKMIVSKIVIILAIPFFLSNFFMYLYIANMLQPFSVALGYESPKQYLMRRMPYYPAFDFANSNLNSTDKVLLIGEQRSYHLRIPFLAPNLFAESPIAEVCNNAKSINEISSFCTENKLTYLLINNTEIDRLGGLAKFGFSNFGALNLKNFVSRKVKVEYENRSVIIGRITGH